MTVVTNSLPSHRRSAPDDAHTSPSTPAFAQARLLLQLLRLRWVLLVLWAGVSCWSAYWPAADWAAFSWGGNLLFGVHHNLPFGPHAALVPNKPGGLHIFANYGFLQTGPVTLVSAAGLGHVGPAHGQYAAAVVISLLGVATLFLLERTAVALRPSADVASRIWIPATTLVGGFVYLQAWSELSGRWGHLDDGLAVFFGALTCWALARRRPVLVGVALGLAAASKPWAIGLAPLVFALPIGIRRAGLLSLVTAVVLPWAPFIVADWHTLKASSIALYIQPASPLAALGMTPGRFHHASSWRVLQFALELTAVGAAVRWRMWSAGLLVCFACRLVIDPMSFSYYQASFAAGAIAFDLLVWKRSLPIASLAAGFCWVVSTNFERASQALPLMVGYTSCLAMVFVLALVRWRSRPIEVSA